MSFSLEKCNHQNLCYIHYDVLIKLSQREEGLQLKKEDTGEADDGQLKVLRRLRDAGIISRYMSLGPYRLTAYGRKLLQETFICPKCEGWDIRKTGFNRYRKQMYQCKTCDRKFLHPKDYISLENRRKRPRTGYTCPRCGSRNVIWSGTNRLASGLVKRKLYCKDCGRSFYPP